MIDKLFGGSIGLILGCLIGIYGTWYVISDHYQKQIAEYDSARDQALADARKTATDAQAKQDAQILSETKTALDVASDAARKSQSDYAALAAHTKAVSNVPEVIKWRSTCIPSQLLAGLPDNAGAGAGNCSGTDKVPSHPR